MDFLKRKYNLRRGKTVEIRGVEYRYAHRDECREIAELYNTASDGVANYYWSTQQKPGESILDTGERLFRELPDFNYDNTIVAVKDGRVVGMLIGFFKEVDESKPLDESTIDPVLLPYIRLEQVQSFYIAGVAVLPEYKQLRVGLYLVDLFFERAIQEKQPKVSAMIFEQKGQKTFDFWNKHYGLEMINSTEIVENEHIKASGTIHFGVSDISRYVS